MPSSNSHLYKNCYGLAQELIDRPSRPNPRLVIADREFSSWDDIQLDDFAIDGYDPHPTMKVEVN